jgi:CheY-like chemotaxis protein
MPSAGTWSRPPPRTGWNRPTALAPIFAPTASASSRTSAGAARSTQVTVVIIAPEHPAGIRRDQTFRMQGLHKGNLSVKPSVTVLPHNGSLSQPHLPSGSTRELSCYCQNQLGSTGPPEAMALDPKSRTRFNLSKTVILLFDPTPVGLAILGQILTGFGARNIHRCSTVAEAKAVVAEHQIDLMIVDAIAESGEGYEFVRWLRKGVPEPNKHVPVLLTAAHTRASDVGKARDCGSHFIVTKPLAPIVVLERIIWIAKEGRAFLLSDNYVGPDRRFTKKGEGKSGHPKRRYDDVAEEEAAEDLDSENHAAVPFIDRPLERAS